MWCHTWASVFSWYIKDQNQVCILIDFTHLLWAMELISTGICRKATYFHNTSILASYNHISCIEKLWMHFLALEKSWLSFWLRQNGGYVLFLTKFWASNLNVGFLVMSWRKPTLQKKNQKDFNLHNVCPFNCHLCTGGLVPNTITCFPIMSNCLRERQYSLKPFQACLIHIWGGNFSCSLPILRNYFCTHKMFTSPLSLSLSDPQSHPGNHSRDSPCNYLPLPPPRPVLGLELQLGTS